MSDLFRIKKLKELLLEAKTAEVLRGLLSYNWKNEQAVMLLQIRFNKLMIQKQEGVIGIEQSNITSNSINREILRIISQLEKKFQQQEKQKESMLTKKTSFENELQNINKEIEKTDESGLTLEQRLLLKSKFQLSVHWLETNKKALAHNAAKKVFTPHEAKKIKFFTKELLVFLDLVQACLVLQHGNLIEEPVFDDYYTVDQYKEAFSYLLKRIEPKATDPPFEMLHSLLLSLSSKLE